MCYVIPIDQSLKASNWEGGNSPALSCSEEIDPDGQLFMYRTW